MTRYAVARGPGPFFFRAPPASPAPARTPPPPFPFVAAVAAAAAMSSARSTLSLREHHRPDKALRGGGGRDEGEAGPRPRGGARDSAHGGRHLERGQRHSWRSPPLGLLQTPAPSWITVITASFRSGSYSLAPSWIRSESSLAYLGSPAVPNTWVLRRPWLFFSL